ncbi:MAG: hypothetical protein KME06_10070 [Kastovskya adunca ATA6-11-RM4]|nr:hypothetical protein [Kastovskya adunca ATA6-11-RM4]
MKVPTDTEIAEQLQALLRTIEQGMNQAGKLLEKSQEIEKHILQHRATIEKKSSQVTTDKTDVSQLVKQTQSELQAFREFHDNVFSTLREIEKRVKEKYSVFEEQWEKQKAASEVAEVIEENANSFRQQVQAELKQFQQNILPSLQQNQQQVEQQRREFEEQIQEQTVELKQLVSQVESEQRIVSQTKQQILVQTSEVLAVKLEVEKLHSAVLSAVQKLGGKEGLDSLRQEYQTLRNALSEAERGNQQLRIQAEEKLREFEQEALLAQDRLALTQQRLQEINDKLSMVDSAIVKQAMAQVAAVKERVRSHEQQLLNELRPAVETILTELGGQAGLETLRHELQVGRQVSREIQQLHQQLQSGVAAAARTMQELLEVHSTIQETASRAQESHSAVSHLAQQVRADREAIATIRVKAETSLAQDSAQINDLDISLPNRLEKLENFSNQLENSQEDLRQKLQALERSNRYLRKWLWGATFGVSLMIALAASVIRFGNI